MEKDTKEKRIETIGNCLINKSIQFIIIIFIIFICQFLLLHYFQKNSTVFLVGNVLEIINKNRAKYFALKQNILN